jgi:protein AroM
MMSSNTVGVIVIGQSPRPEIEQELRLVLGPDLPIRLVGALDGMTRRDIDGLAPSGSDDTLFTRLPNGDGIVVAKHAVTEGVQRRLRDFEVAGIDVALLACTGAFPAIDYRGFLIEPSPVLHHAVLGLLSKGRIGVFNPLPEQREQVARKWQKEGWRIEFEALLPGSDPGTVEAAARRMAGHRPDLVVLDCMGYTQDDKERVRRVTGCRAVLGVSASARALQELLT